MKKKDSLMKNKDNGIFYKLFVIGVLILLDLFTFFDMFSSNPYFNSRLSYGHIPFFYLLLLPSFLLIFILSYFTYNSVKNSKAYSKNFYIKAFLAIAFVFGLLIGLLILVGIILPLVLSSVTR